MADRNVAVRLTANVSGLVAGFKTAQRSAQDLATKGLDRIHQNQGSINELSNTVGMFGLALVGAATGAAKAAIDWESAWAGVLKTVDGTPAQLADIEDGLRGLARELPASHAEIAAVAEAAGQLGVKADDVVEFTRTMINLGETTNMSADEAATALARISNIMGTSTDDVDRMASVIVELGNNSATTEREITELATRLAAAGRQAGLTEADIFAIAATMSSVGVEAEAGGTAMSKVFTNIADAVKGGNDNLETFAEVSGVTAEEFKRAFEQDAAGAIGMFVEGMGRMTNEGESTTQVFKDLGLTDNRLKNAIGAAASATGLWADNLGMAADEWDTNTAAAIEAQKRYETAAAQIQIAWNNIKDAAIEFGAAVLPMVAELAGAVQGLAQWFGNLPDPIQSVITILTGAGGLVALGLAGLAKLTIGIASTRVAMQNLGISASTTRSLVGGVGIALGIAAVGVTTWMAAQKEAEAKVNALSDSLDAQTGALTDNSRAWVTAELTKDQSFGINNTKSMADAAEEMGISLETLTAAYEGNQDAAAEAKAKADEYAAAHPIWKDAMQGAASMADRFNRNLDDQADRLEQARKIGEQKAEIDGEAADAQGDLAGEYALTTDTVEEQTDALADLIEMQREAAGVVISQMEAEAAFEKALDDATQAVKENGASLDLTTEKGRANQSALLDISEAGYDLIESMRANGASQEDIQGVMATTRERFLNAASAMGLGSEKAEELADELGLIPANVTADVAVTGIDGALSRLGALDRTLNTINGKTVTAAVAVKQYGQAAMATGGMVRGPGTGTSDSIPARLSNGEYVVKASAVSRYGKAFFDEVNAMRFATGGMVGRAPAVAPVQATGGGQSFHVDSIVAADPREAVKEFKAGLALAMAGSRG